MVLNNYVDITLYLVGADEDDARSGMVFDSEESAESYRRDEYGDDGKIYYVTAYIDFDTMRGEE